MNEHTASIPLRTWLVDPDYLTLCQMRERLELLLRQRLEAEPIPPVQAFALGHAAGGIFEAVEHGLMGVVASIGDVMASPIFDAGWSIPGELDELLNAAAAIGERRAGLRIEL